MEYKNCYFFTGEGGIWVQFGKQDGEHKFLENGFFAVVKTKTGKISFVREYKKENGIAIETNRYYPSKKCTEIQ